MGSTAIRARNLAAYDAARDELSQHPGEFVTVRNGRVVAFSRTFDEAFHLAEGDPDALVLEVGAEPVREPVQLGSHRWRSA